MTTPAPSCPGCGAPLTGAPACPTCGLRLLGPEAARLWTVDTELAALEERRTALRAEREPLLAALRPGGTPLVDPARAGSLAPAPAPSVAPATQAPEWTPKRVQNTLLTLGALLLAIAGVVFTAVTYDRLGAGGRAAVLAALTAIAGLATPWLRRRGLLATAEAVAAVTLVLAALDAYGLRTLGLAATTDPEVYTAGAAAVLAGLTAAYATLVPVHLLRYAAVALAHLPVPLLLGHHRAGAGTTGLWLSAVVAADLALWWATRGWTGSAGRDVRRAAVVGLLATAPWALLGAGIGAFDARPQSARGGAALVVLALTSATAAWLTRTTTLRFLAAGAVAPLIALAAFAAATGGLTDVQRPLVLVAVGLLAVQVAGLLPRPWRPGGVFGAVAVTLAALATQAEPLAHAALLPLTWLDQPWTLVAGSDARSALSPSTAWDGTVVTLVVLAAAAAAALGAGLALDRLTTAAVPAGALIVLAAVVLPLGLATSYRLAIGLLVGCTAALLGVAAQARRRELADAAMAVATALALLTAAWATADRVATLATLTALTLLFAGTAGRRPEAAGLAGLAAGALLAAGGAARGLRHDQVGGLLLLGPAALVGLGFVLPGLRRRVVEVAAAVLGLASLALVVPDPGWSSWALAALGLVALAEALHTDRRPVAYAGSLLLAASSWVRLADADVQAPEPYVLPLGLVALGLGVLRARRAPHTGSFSAYGPALSLLLVPSLLASLDDPTATRGLLLALACVVALLVGAALRLKAPLVVGGAVLVVDALNLLGPYAAALPRWLTLGSIGLLLVGVGATYEQRRRDVDRLRERYDALT